MEGLIVEKEVISPELESRIIKCLNSNSRWFNIGNREVQHWGYIYDYKSYTLTKTDPIPPILDLEIKVDGKVMEYDQCIVNKYTSKQGIGPHIDHPKLFDDMIAIISLGAAADMVFTRDDEKIDIRMEPRSIIILSGEARYKWKHAIPPRVRAGERISLTYRLSK